MLVLHIIVTFAIIFIAGMHYTLWKVVGESESMWYAAGLGVLGLYSLVSTIGYVAKHAS